MAHWGQMGGCVAWTMGVSPCLKAVSFWSESGGYSAERKRAQAGNRCGDMAIISHEPESGQGRIYRQTPTGGGCVRFRAGVGSRAGFRDPVLFSNL